MILLLFFNWYGYRIMISAMTKDADRRLESQLDNNDYAESDLLEMRVAINMPYQTSQMEFERHYGEIEIDGKYYTYVKRKIEDGFLILKCIPNSSKEKIKAAGNDFFKMANGLDQDQPGKKQEGNSSFAKNFWSEYDGQENNVCLNPLFIAGSDIFLRKSSSLFDVILPSQGHPPKATA